MYLFLDMKFVYNLPNVFHNRFYNLPKKVHNSLKDNSHVESINIELIESILAYEWQQENLWAEEKTSVLAGEVYWEQIEGGWKRVLSASLFNSI